MFLVKKRFSEAEKRRIKSNRAFTPRKSHIWLSDENDTACHMYSGHKENKPETFSEDLWHITDDKPYNLCRMCIKNQKKS